MSGKRRSPCAGRARRQRDPIGPPALKAFLCAILLAGCGAASGPDNSNDRATQAPVVLAEVLRYELQQFVAAHEPEGATICVAVKEAGGPVDPSVATLKTLGREGLLPISRCGDRGDITLVAGPIEWISDSEVRAKGSYRRRTGAGSAPVYRVVRESGRWTCVGPILSFDPF